VIAPDVPQTARAPIDARRSSAVAARYAPGHDEGAHALLAEVHAQPTGASTQARRETTGSVQGSPTTWGPQLAGERVRLDGTFVDSERDGHRVAFERAFDEAGLPDRCDVDHCLPALGGPSMPALNALVRVTGAGRSRSTGSRQKGRLTRDFMPMSARPLPGSECCRGKRRLAPSAGSGSGPGKAYGRLR
jgi:hypothetical protein